MSIEKFNPIVSGETIPYVQVNTAVIQNISDPLAGFIWVYLLTLPKDWVVVKTHIKNHFGIGDDRIKKIFAYLNKHKLIEYIRERDELGKLRKTEIRVLNGSRYTKDTITTGVKTTRVENHTCGKPPTTNNINKQMIQREQRIYFGDSHESHPKEPATLFDQRLTQENGGQNIKLIDSTAQDNASKENYRQNNDQFLGKNTENKQISDKNPINFELNLAKEPTTTIIPKPKAKKVKKRTKVPLDYQPLEKHYQFCSESGLDIKVQLSKFIAKHKSSGWFSLDWDAEFDYFLLNGKEIQQRFNQVQPKKNTVVGYLKGLGMKPSSNNRSLEHGITIG